MMIMKHNSNLHNTDRDIIVFFIKLGLKDEKASQVKV